MKQQIYSIRDIKGELYQLPVYFPARGRAIQQFADEINDEKKETMLAKHPADYQLFYLGDFDTRTGEVIIKKNPELVADGNSYVEKKG